VTLFKIDPAVFWGDFVFLSALIIFYFNTLNNNLPNINVKNIILSTYLIVPQLSLIVSGKVGCKFPPQSYLKVIMYTPTHTLLSLFFQIWNALKVQTNSLFASKLSQQWLIFFW
jgi:hypothetical protein